MFSHVKGLLACLRGAVLYSRHAEVALIFWLITVCQEYMYNCRLLGPEKAKYSPGVFFCDWGALNDYGSILKKSCEKSKNQVTIL